MNKQLDVRSAPKSPAATGDLWSSFRTEMDDLFNRFSGGFEALALKPFSDLEDIWSKSFRGFAPLAVEVAEDDKTYTITAELPGVDEKNIDISVQDGVLTLKGEKRELREEKSKHRYMSERRYGSFQRMFGLPKGTDVGKVEANFHNGVLTVSVPKPAATPARKVDVKAA
jgi:HSP20 family protein